MVSSLKVALLSMAQVNCSFFFLLVYVFTAFDRLYEFSIVGIFLILFGEPKLCAVLHSQKATQVYECHFFFNTDFLGALDCRRGGTLDSPSGWRGCWVDGPRSARTWRATSQSAASVPERLPSSRVLPTNKIQRMWTFSRFGKNLSLAHDPGSFPSLSLDRIHFVCPRVAQ